MCRDETAAYCHQHNGPVCAHTATECPWCSEVKALKKQSCDLLAACRDLLADVMNLGSYSITSRPSVEAARAAVNEHGALDTESASG